MYLESKKPKTLKEHEGVKKGEQIQISEFLCFREDPNLSCSFGVPVERLDAQLHYLQGKGRLGQSDYGGISHSATGHSGLLG